MTQAPIRVLIVDDHAIVRKGTNALLAEVDGVEVVGEASNGQEAIDQAETLQPDVILMDLVMPKVDGIEAITKITASRPSIGILALTSFDTDDKVFPAMKAGALGYLLKDTLPEDLVRAIRQVHRGEPSLHPRIAKKVLQELSRPAEGPPTPDPLTERELEVLGLVSKGLSNKEIADQLHLSYRTVEGHMRDVFNKLGVGSRTEAVLFGLKKGWFTLEELA